MNVFIKNLFTGKDNQTWNLARVSWGMCTFVFLVLSSYDVIWLKHAFVMQDFGLGIGAIMASGGAAVGFQGKTEPGA